MWRPLVFPSGPSRRRGSDRSWRWGKSPVGGELQGDAEVAAFQQSDDGLQVVFLLARDAKLVALDLGLHAFELLVPDRLGDLLGFVLADALQDASRGPVDLAGDGRVVHLEGLQRDAPLDQLALDDVDGGAAALLGLRLNGDRLVTGPGRLRPGASEVEPGRQLLDRLIESVVHFLPIDLADHIERRIRHRSLLPLSRCRPYPSARSASTSRAVYRDYRP